MLSSNSQRLQVPIERLLNRYRERGATDTLYVPSMEQRPYACTGK